MKQNYKIYINNKQVFVKEEVYRAYWKSVEHEHYQIHQDKNNISLDDIKSGTSSSFIELQYLYGTDPTKEAVDKQLLKDKLEQVLDCIDPKERELIDMIYFKQMTEVEVAQKWNTKQSVINKRKHRILRKLRVIWENLSTR